LSERRALFLAWYLPLLSGVLPILLYGFLASALADRTVFAGWALAAAALHTVVLRQGLAAGWPWARIGGAVLLAGAAALAGLAYLLQAHREILDLGARAVLPERWQGLMTVPPPAVAALAGACAGLGALAVAGSIAGTLKARRQA
jgi:hypothetical protein